MHVHTHRWIRWGWYFLRNVRVSSRTELRHDIVLSQERKWLHSQIKIWIWPGWDSHLTYRKNTSYRKNLGQQRKQSKIRILLGNADNFHSNQSKELDALLNDTDWCSLLREWILTFSLYAAIEYFSHFNQLPFILNAGPPHSYKDHAYMSEDTNM